MKVIPHKLLASSYSALVSDFDGTIGNREGISPRVQNAIRRWVRAGKIFIICTGRQYVHVAPYCRKLHLVTPQVTRGGAEIYDPRTDTIIWSQYVHPADVKRVMSILDRHTILYQLEEKNIVYTRDGKPIEKYADVVFKSFAELHTPSVAKILIVGTGNEECVEQVLQKEIRVRVPGVSAIRNNTFGLTTWDVTSVHADKYQALCKVSDMVHVTLHQMLGIGDSYNDIPFLQACGYTVVMGHAASGVKKVADYIAPTFAEDGLAWVIDTVLSSKINFTRKS